MNLETMNLDELFVALRAAAIAEYESKEGKPQHDATRAEGAIVREVALRDGHEMHYRRMIDDEHPRVRYRGAVGLEKTDPSTSLRILREIATDYKLSAGLPVVASQEVRLLERQGVT